MCRTLSLVTAIVILSSCSKSDGVTQDAFDCNCNQKKVVDTPNEIDGMREELVKKWSDFKLKKDEVEVTVSDVKGGIKESYDDKVCSYEYNGISYKTSLLEYENDDGKLEAGWSTIRTIKSYTLGEDTTADPNICHENANGEDPMAILSSALFATSILYIDKFPNNDEDYKTALSNLFQKNMNSKIIKKLNENTQIIPIRMVEGEINGLRMYSISFSVKDPHINGVWSYNFGVDNSPMGFLWSMRFKGTDDGQPVNVQVPHLTSINGIPVH